MQMESCLFFKWKVYSILAAHWKGKITYHKHAPGLTLTFVDRTPKQTLTASTTASLVPRLLVHRRWIAHCLLYMSHDVHAAKEHLVETSNSLMASQKNWSPGHVEYCSQYSTLLNL